MSSLDCVPVFRLEEATRKTSRRFSRTNAAQSALIYEICGSNLLLVGSYTSGLLVLETGSVVLHEFLHVAVAPASIEVVLLHLRIDLIVIPVVVIKPVNRAHDTRAMAAAGAVYKKLASRRIVHELQELIDLRALRITRVAHRNVDVLHSQRFDFLLLVRCWVVLQVDHGVDSERGQFRVLILLRLSTTKEPIVHLAEVLDAYFGSVCFV